MISIVIPVYNEEDNIVPLHELLISSLESLDEDWEILFINDGSVDRSEERIRKIADQDQRIRLISFSRNFGQTAAIQAGIDHSQGEVVIPMDGDLQNDPKDIRLMLTKLREGYDVVSGWRKDRLDNPIRRNLPSRIANKLISMISGVHLHDYGCTLKAYRKEVIKGVSLYGEMHRFIPIYAFWMGGKVTEIPVTHHPRRHGTSKYGLERTFKVLLDLMVVQFLFRYSVKPIYVFGFFGVSFLSLGLLSGAYALYLKFFQGVFFIQTPLPLLVVMCLVTGVMCLLMGLLAEMIVRTYYESQQKPVYHVKEMVNFNP